MSSNHRISGIPAIARAPWGLPAAAVRQKSRAARGPILADRIGADPACRDHCGPKLHGVESCATVPIVRADGSYFGNLCAVGRRARPVSDARTAALFASMSRMIALRLDRDDLLDRADAEVLAQRKAGELREQFIAVLGHDLRDPLAAIDSSAALLARRPDPDSQRIGGRITLSVRRMQGLIDNVMDLARVQLGSGIGLARRSAESLAAALAPVPAATPGPRAGRLDVRPRQADTGRVRPLPGRHQETAMRIPLRSLLGLAFAALILPASAAGPQDIRTDPRVPAPAPRLQPEGAPPAVAPTAPAAATDAPGAARPASAPRRALQAAQRGIDDTARVHRRTTVPRPVATPRQRPIAP